MFSLTVYLSLCSVLMITQEDCFATNVNEIQFFEMFKKTYAKVYSTGEEHNKRQRIFLQNMKKAEELQKGDLSQNATYGVTEFSDLSAEEFKEQYLGGLKMGHVSVNSTLFESLFLESKIPENFDWRTRNVVTRVQYQGKCNSCWAFSAAGVIEGQYAIKTKKLISLSVQELLDCDIFNGGCDGGLMTSAYETVISLGGLAAASDYPYENRKGYCRSQKKAFKVNIKAGVMLGSNEDDIARYLYHNGPIAIGMNSVLLQYYSGGIAHPSHADCNPNAINHGVLLVGYGKETNLFSDDVPYWIVKNSWGTAFGEMGYMRIYRGDGTCGVNKYVSSAIM